jgi:15-cis-phytoene synthase
LSVTLEDSYGRCRQYNRRFGKSYYAATWLLPPVKRHHVHALYAFCRYADDIVDGGTEAPGPALAAFGARFFADLDAGRSEDPVLKAVVHTVRAFDIEPQYFRRFLASMAMDLDVTRYATFAALDRYMDGSAAVIGEMMLPILEPFDPAAFGHARDLGIGFQLTNFLRDVGEDLNRGRVYLPTEDIDGFGAGPALEARRVTPQWIELMRFEIARTQRYYASGALGIGMLPPTSARCVQGAHRLYRQILERIEAANFDVFSRRAEVSSWKKAAIAAQALRSRP